MKKIFKNFLSAMLVFSLLFAAIPVNAANYIPSSRKSVVFDRNYYAKYSSDVIPGFGSSENGLYTHFYNYGISEGRQGSPIFNVKYYMQNNTDLSNGFGSTNYIEGMKHFVNYGWKESFRTQTAPYMNLGDSFETKIICKNGLVLDYLGTNVILNKDTAFDSTQIWKFIRNSDGSYSILNKTTGHALSLESYTYLSGTNVCLREVSTNNAQRWYIHKYSTDTYVLRPLTAPSCVLEMEGLNVVPCTNVEIFTYNGGSNQLFKFDNNTSFSNVTPVIFDSNYYAEYSSDVIPGFGSSANGLYTHFYNYGINEGRQGSPIFNIKYYMQNNNDLSNGFGSTNYMEGMKHFVNYGWKESFRTQTAPYMNFGDSFETNLVCSNGLALDYNDTNVVLDIVLNDDTQVWQFTQNNDGSYTIVNKANGLALSLEYNTYLSGTNVCLKEATTSNSQRWYIHKYSTDSYVLRPLSAPSCILEMEGLSVEPGTNVEIFTYNGGSNQLFTFQNHTIDEYVEYINYRNPLINTNEKLNKDKELSVLFYGGSLTEGHGATNKTEYSWRGLTCKWFEDNFTDVDFTFHNKAIGESGTFLGTYRLKLDVIDVAPDLVFLEYAINDRYFGSTYNETLIRCETIVREIKQALPQTEIVMLITTDRDCLQTNSQGLLHTQGLAHEAVAKAYDIPSLHIGMALAEKCGYSSDVFNTYAIDVVHLNDAGYAIYFDCVEEYLQNSLLKTDFSNVTNADKNYPMISNELFDGNRLHIQPSQELIQLSEYNGGSGVDFLNQPYTANSSSVGLFLLEDTDDLLVYKFTGTEIAMWCSLLNGKCLVSIDGSEYKTITTTVHNPAIIAQNLSSKEHVVKIKAVENNGFTIYSLFTRDATKATTK